MKFLKIFSKLVCLPLDERSLRIVRATDFTSSLINVALSQDVPFHQQQQLQCLHHGTTFVPLCAPIISSQQRVGNDLQ